MNRPRIAVLGAGGQLGHELCSALAPIGTILPFTRSEADLAAIDALLPALREARPDLLVNAAAYTQVDQAEAEPDAARAVNAHAPGELARLAREANIGLIHYSTDFVFDGTARTPYSEDARTGPLNHYARTKLEGEQAIIAQAAPAIIFRTSWVYSTRRECFVRRLLAWMEARAELRIATDQAGSPTWARTLAQLTAAAILRNAQPDEPLAGLCRRFAGIYHLANAGAASRHELACAVLDLHPLRACLPCSQIHPARAAEFPAPAPRPAYTALDCSRFERTFRLRVPGWRESLALALQDRFA